MDSGHNGSKIKADTIVIGAGPAGLGAALALGDSATVLESRETVGGLCSTVTLDGAIFDLGGHSFHTRIPKFVVLCSMHWKWRSRTATHGAG